MTSQLASQLQRLQQRPDESSHRLAKSFLFSTQDAQSFSREQVHQLALNGLQTLVAMDNRFHPFIDNLFDGKRVRQERAMLSSTEDATLRARLEHFLTLLSPHLFLTAAQQVFEYLVRVYEVHVYDVPAVLRAFLPYHDHNIFARALLLLDLRDTGFEFLSTNQLRGAPLLREHLVLACAESRKAARLVCLAVAMPFRYEIRHHAANALFTAVVTHLCTHKDAEALWRTFLPFVLELLSGAVTGAEAGTEESKRAQQLRSAGGMGGGSSRVSQESMATALVVLAAWSSHVRFSTAMLNTVLKPFFRYLAAASAAVGNPLNASSSSASVAYLPVHDLLAFLEVVFATQYRAISDVAVAPLVQSLLTLPWCTLAGQLPTAGATEVVVVGSAGLPSTSPRHSALLAALLRSALDRLTRTPELRLLPSDVSEFLTCAAEDLPLSHGMVASYVRVLMTAEAGAAAESAASGLYHRLVAALERRYSVVFDEVLAEVLQHPETTAAATAFLLRHFSGTRYSMVEVGSAVPGASESLPLFACLLHPVAEVRAVAAATMRQMTLAQWLGNGAGGSGQSLISLLAQVTAYEHVTNAAEPFVEAAAALLEKLTTTQWASDASSVPAACQLIRALYSMTRGVLEGNAAHPAALKEAVQRVALPLLTKVLRPAVTEWTSSATSDTSATADSFRACVLYHATLLQLQWSPNVQVFSEALVTLATVLNSGCDKKAAEALESFLHPSSTPSASSLRGTKGGPKKRKSKKGGRATADSDSDDEVDSKKATKGNCSTSTAAAAAASSGAVVTASFAGLVGCGNLLLAIRVEAQAHLSEAFCAARAGATAQVQDSAVGLEVAVAVAATLLPIDAHSDAIATTAAIADFLHGTVKTEKAAASAGYLDVLFSALLERNGGGQVAAQTGRGAADATATARAAMADVPLVQHLRLLLSAGLQAALETTSSSAAAAALVRELFLMLGRLGAALPAVTSCAELLAPVYLDLLSQAPAATAAAAEGSDDTATAAAQLVDWDALVSAAVFDAHTGEWEACGPISATASLAGLALTLLLPLRAPSSQRLAQLRILQDCVVTSPSRRPASPAHGIVAAAMKHHSLSVTALNSLIESMAVEERQYQLTTTAAELLCQLLTLQRVETEATCYVVPAGWAYRAIQYFFAVPTAGGGSGRRGSTTAAVSPQLRCLVQDLLPRVESILTASGVTAKGSKSASGNRQVTADAADLAEAVCRRLQLWAESDTSADAVSSNASVRLLGLLLRYPYLHVSGGGAARALYRHALTAFSLGLSEGLVDRHTAKSTIFTRSGKTLPTPRGSTSAKEGSVAMTPAYQQAIAAHLQPALLRAMDNVGTDVAVACVQTLGGYEYVFLPLLSALEKAGDETPAKGKSPKSATALRQSGTAVVLLQQVREMLEVLAPGSLDSTVRNNAGADEDTAAVRWRPPQFAAIAAPLSYADVQRLVQLPRLFASDLWALNEMSLQSLRLLRTLLQVLPTVVVNEDAEEEDEGKKSKNEGPESIYRLVEQCVELYPLQEMEHLLRAAASSAAEDEVALLPRVQQVRLGARGSVQVEAVLRYVVSLVRVCTEQTRLLTETVADGAYQIKSRVLRGMMLLMARVLADADEDAEADKDRGIQQRRIGGGKKRKKAAEESNEVPAEQRTTELHFHVDTIASLLRATAPLLKMPAGTTSISNDGGITFLHLPLVSLLIKLEAVEGTEALDFCSAREVCQEILTSFDIQTQVQCVAQLMRLVVDPAAQLASAASQVAAAEEEEGNEMARNRAERQRIQHLFRRMVKPNQVTNRQETILHLVNLTVKSDLFLEPFLTLQRHARSSQGSGNKSKKGKRGSKADAKATAEDEEEEADGEPEDVAEGMTQKEDGGCMELLVSALELFSHYHDLHVEKNHTYSSHSSKNASTTEESTAEVTAYTALLEVLAGNTLACVLAGINEPTFVVCQQRLLGDRRAALRKVGLEVLLDRLHHSLPTLENVVSDEDLEAHRRRLRDPRERLTLMDLVRIKARPLTTKRSTILFPLLVQEIQSSVTLLYAALQTETSSEDASATMERLLTSAQLGVACVEELVRIVSSGGSMQSERTLLNAGRSKRVTEGNLVKLFGNRGRVTEVHDFVNTVCDQWMPLLARCEMRLRAHHQPQRSGTTAGPISSMAVEEGLLGCMTCLMTTMATVVQVMGNSFASSHALALLHTLVSAGVYQLMEMPGVVSRSQAGALLRHSTLSALIRCFPACWQLTQPYLPSLLFIASHLTNVMDAESHYLCSEMLAVLEAVMEPQLLLDAGTSCLQGTPYANGAVVPASEQHQLRNLTAAKETTSASPARRTKLLRVEAHTHSFSLLFTCMERRIEHLSKEELVLMPTLMSGNTPQQNFWLAAFNSLASAPTVPSGESVAPVLAAYTVFLLKFKAKHGTRLLRLVADWAFAETSGGVTGSVKSRAKSTTEGDEEEVEGRGHDGAAHSISRLTLQSWIVFFALGNHLLSKLGAIFDFAFPTLLPNVVTTLRSYCATSATASKATEGLVALALEGALACLCGMAQSQTPGPDHDYSLQHDVYLAHVDVFPGVMPALVHQLHNLYYLEDGQHDYHFRIQHNVIPAIRAFMACLGSGKLQSKTQAEVVRCLRHPSRHVRQASLSCLDAVYADGGEELASRLMAEMLPTVVELTEDRDDAVVEAARKLCNNLSHMTGQDVLYAMS